MVTRDGITVLPADDPNRPTLGWVVRERDGTTVHKADVPDMPLTRRDDIAVGDKVLVAALTGIYEMTVVEKDGVLWAEDGGMRASLVFDHDDRHCWVSTYGMNLRGVRRLTLQR